MIRDDGPIAIALARLGRGLPATALALAAFVPPLAAIALGRSHVLMLGAVVWVVFFGGVSAGGRRDRFDWVVPGLVRAGEYGLLVWMGLDGGFALAFALTLLHYDLVYRPRNLGAEPIVRWAGGWDCRLIVAWILLAIGAAPAGFFVLAALIALLWLGGSPLVQRQGDAA